MKIPAELCKIPGYEAAVIRENEIRNAAILNLNTRICGIEIRQINLRHWIIFDDINSPLFCGGIPTPADVVMFLWVLSPQFNPKQNSFAKWRFIRSCRKIIYADAVMAIRKFVDETFQDEPPHVSDSTKRGWSAPDCSFAANLVHQICTHYSWSAESVMDLPIKSSLQYLKCIRMVTEGSAAASGWNPSDILKTKYSRKCREERELKRLRARIIDLLKSRN